MANNTWDDFRGLLFREFPNDLSFVCMLSWLAKDQYAWGEKKNDRSCGSRRKHLAWSCGKFYFESHPYKCKKMTCSLIMPAHSMVTAGKESSGFTENNKWPFILFVKGAERAASQSTYIFNNNMRLYANTLIILPMASIENMETQVPALRRYWCIFVYSNILTLPSKFLTENEKNGINKNTPL